MVVGREWKKSIKIDFAEILNDNSSVLCTYGTQFLLKSDEDDNAVKYTVFYG